MILSVYMQFLASMQGDEIGMVDNRDGISYKETQDPQACNQPESGNWKELSRDPERKSD